MVASLIPSLLAPLIASTISLNVLQSDPNRYIVIDEDKTYTIYIDSDSIESIRYYPPYYTMQVKVFLVSYPDSNIGDSLYTINYDYNHSVDDLIAKALKEDLTRSFEDCMKYVYREAMKNSGITFNTSSSACYDFKGNYLSPVPSMSGDASYYSPIFHVAFINIMMIIFCQPTNFSF